MGLVPHGIDAVSGCATTRLISRKSGAHHAERYPYPFVKPVSHHHHKDQGSTPTGSESEENKRTIEHGKGLGKAEEDETHADRDYAIWKTVAKSGGWPLSDSL